MNWSGKSPNQLREEQRLVFEKERQERDSARAELSDKASVLATFIVYICVVSFSFYLASPIAGFLAMFVGWISIHVSTKKGLIATTIVNVVIASFIQWVMGLFMQAGNATQNYSNKQCNDPISLYEILIKLGENAEPPHCVQLGNSIYDGANSLSTSFGFNLIAWVGVEFLIFLLLFSLLYFPIRLIKQSKYGYL